MNAGIELVAGGRDDRQVAENTTVAVKNRGRRMQSQVRVMTEMMDTWWQKKMIAPKRERRMQTRPFD